MRTYEITFEAPNGDWHWYRIEAVDFHAAVENTMQSAKLRPEQRLIRIDHIPDTTVV